MKKHTRLNTNSKILVIALTILITVFGIAYNPQQASSDEPATPNESQIIDSLTQQIQKLTDDNARISMNAKTGMVRFIGTDTLNAIFIPAALESNYSPEQAARIFLSIYGRLFGINDQANELDVMESNTVDNSRSFTRFQQVYDDIPILGGELIIQVDSNNNIVSASSDILPKISLNVTPTISPSTAQETALGIVARTYGLDTNMLTATEPELWIYNPIILGMNQNLTTLVWRIEVMSTDGALVDELVLVNAHVGFVALHFNQIETAKHRDVYTAKSGGVCTTSIPGTLQRSEGDAATGYTDVDKAYTYTGYTYDYYWSEHGRDSIDNAGMTIISTVDYDDGSYGGTCNYRNAGWTGSQMIFGTGYASACDVVGHELTHGVTEHESNLFYFMQSGAINEGLSDIWGEFIELTYNPGLSAYRWLMGEDLPIGAIRSMKNPPTYGDPDKMTSTYYYSCGTVDNGGVHTNSGVLDKAAYLMTDGATFNGYVVTGIGIPKVADLFYEVQTNLLTSGSDYADMYDALQQAAINLGYNASERQTVKNAIDATEMDHQPTWCPASEAPLCDSGVPCDLFFDDMENPASGNWTFGYYEGDNYWDYAIGYATSGQYCLYGYEYDYRGDYYVAMTSDVALTTGRQYYLHFKHYYMFDAPNYDGGVVEYSTNGGSSWNDSGSLFTHNGYTGTIHPVSYNPLRERSAFIGGYTSSYLSSRLNLSSLAGQNVRFRFRIGTDDTTHSSTLGWCIDDVRIYTPVCYLNTSATTGGTVTTPGIGSFIRNSSEVVNISAAADPCYYFLSWSGNTPTIANRNSSATTITMNGNCSITANFAVITYNLSTTANNSGGSPYFDGSSPFNCGVNASIHANTGPCHTFSGWTPADGVANASAEDTTVSMTQDRIITANFTPTGATYNLTINSSEYGNVSIPGEGSPIGTYNCGETVNLTAVTDLGYEFVSWSGDTDTIANTNSPSTIIVMNGEYSITANFGLPPSGNYSDANNDDHINATDISYIKAAILGRWITPNPGTDGNADGLITATDISYVKAYILGRWNGSPKYEVPFDFLSAAGSDKGAKINTIPSNPPAGNFDSESGWTEASPTDYNCIAVNDSNIWTVSGTSGNYSALQCKFTVVSNPVNITSIGITLNGSSNINASTLRFWAWNFNTSSWRQLGTDFSITTSLSTYTIWSFWGKVYSSYVDGSNHMFILATLNTSAANFNINYIKLEIAYP
jgi:bacillolysin